MILYIYVVFKYILFHFRTLDSVDTFFSTFGHWTQGGGDGHASTSHSEESGYWIDKGGGARQSVEDLPAGSGTGGGSSGRLFQRNSLIGPAAL